LIKNIVYDKARSLQSAAKAPILVTFIVQNCAVVETREDNAEVDQSFMTVINIKDKDTNLLNRKSLNMSDFSLLGQKKSSKDINKEVTQDKDFFEKALIFKTKDDLRQDNFCLQLIFLFKKMFSISQIPLFVKFYETISCLIPDGTSGHGELGGMIDVLENSISRHEIGKKGYNLKKYYITK